MKADMEIDNLLNDLESLSLPTVNIKWEDTNLSNNTRQKFEDEVYRYRTVNGMRISSFIKSDGDTKLIIKFNKGYYIAMRVCKETGNLSIATMSPVLGQGGYVDMVKIIYQKLKKIAHYEIEKGTLTEIGITEPGRLAENPMIYIRLLNLLDVNVDDIHGRIRIKKREEVENQILKEHSIIKMYINSIYGGTSIGTPVITMTRGTSVGIRNYSGGIVINTADGVIFNPTETIT